MLGKFISPDTITPDPEDPQSLNHYSYVINNPLYYADTTGQEPDCYSLNNPGDTSGVPWSAYSDTQSSHSENDLHFSFTPFGYSVTIVAGDWFFHNFGLSGSFSVSITDDYLAVLELQATYYDKALGAYIGGGRQVGFGVNKDSIEPGYHKDIPPKDTAAAGGGWKKGEEVQVVGDKKALSVQVSVKDTAAFGAYLAVGKTDTSYYAIDLNPLLGKIDEIMETIWNVFKK